MTVRLHSLKYFDIAMTELYMILNHVFSTVFAKSNFSIVVTHGYNSASFEILEM